jgi:hypothetical protein
VPCTLRSRSRGAIARAWNGVELTDAARAQYSPFLEKLSLMPHVTYPVSDYTVLISSDCLGAIAALRRERVVPLSFWPVP